MLSLKTIIVTDMWKLDFGLISDGRQHFTVGLNHFINFVDPITSANTQAKYNLLGELNYQKVI